MTALAERYTEVKERVAQAAIRSGRSPESVYLIAVAKYAEPEDIRELIELGHRDFGENRVQQLAQRAGIMNEWFDRIRSLPRTSSDSTIDVDVNDPVRWHMIGRLQRNKARKIADCTRLIHSVDSLRLAEELQVVANKLDRVIDVLVQVNVSGEDSKAGLPIAALGAIAEQIDTMINVRVRGLMTMAPITDDPENSRMHFSRCKEIFDDLIKAGVGEDHFNLLSMGMSGDYEVAIEEGANLVRVGTAIFGHKEIDPSEDGDVEADAESAIEHAVDA